jgi:hypothetical protein
MQFASFSLEICKLILPLIAQGGERDHVKNQHQKIINIHLKYGEIFIKKKLYFIGFKKRDG